MDKTQQGSTVIETLSEQLQELVSAVPAFARGEWNLSVDISNGTVRRRRISLVLATREDFDRLVALHWVDDEGLLAALNERLARERGS